MVNSACWLLLQGGDPVSNSQQPCGSSQPCTTPVPGHLMPFSDVPGHQACVWYIYTCRKNAHTLLEVDSWDTIQSEKQLAAGLALPLRDLGSVTSTRMHAGKIPINIYIFKKVFFLKQCRKTGSYKEGQLLFDKSGRGNSMR